MNRRERLERVGRLEALVRAALLHRAGRSDLLFFAMREAWDEKALAELGFASVAQVIAEAERIRAARIPGDERLG